MALCLSIQLAVLVSRLVYEVQRLLTYNINNSKYVELEVKGKVVPVFFRRAPCNESVMEE